MKEEKPIEINERSRVPLYILVCAIGATISIVTLLVNISWRIAELDKDVRNGWTLHDQEIWTLKLSRQNPALNVPDPWNPAQPTRCVALRLY